MKKILIMGTAALALTACTSQEDVYSPTSSEAQEIVLTNLSLKSSRAIVEGTALKSGTDKWLPMYVYANYFDGGSNYSSYFNGGELKFAYSTTEESKDIFKGEKTYYYPLAAAGSKMWFAAYATGGYVKPTATWNTTAINADWASLASNSTKLYGLTFSPALDGKDDILYSDVAVAAKFPPDNVPELTFSHSQAWLVFNIKAKDAATVTGIKVKSLKLASCYVTGSAEVKLKDNSGSPTTELTWANGTASEQYVIVSSSGSYESISTATATTGNILVLPQNKVNFTIEYQMQNGISGGTADTTTNLTYTYTHTSGEKWEMGKKYIYDITIGLNEITLAASVANWTDGGTTTVDLPQSGS